jgi:voltage-gated potassium channel
VAGYGDRYPVTTTGRMIATGLMLAGIALLGIVTASLASWLLEKVQEVEAKSQAATQRDVETLVQEVRRLREELVSQRATGAIGPTHAGD